jgi:hypothetical protein
MQIINRITNKFTYVFLCQAHGNEHIIHGRSPNMINQRNFEFNKYHFDQTLKLIETQVKRIKPGFE